MKLIDFKCIINFNHHYIQFSIASTVIPQSNQTIFYLIFYSQNYAVCIPKKIIIFDSIILAVLYYYIIYICHKFFENALYNLYMDKNA